MRALRDSERFNYRGVFGRQIPADKRVPAEWRNQLWQSLEDGF